MITNKRVIDPKRDIDALADAFYRAVSFDIGEKPPYENLYNLFIEGALLIRNTTSAPEIASVSQFIEPRQRMVDAGELMSFTEAETAEVTEIFGNVAQRFSTYEKRGVRNGKLLEGRGIISMQFIMTARGWRMSAMAWDDEREGLIIPDRYLPKGD